MDTHMNLTKLFIFILLSLVCSYANVVEDIHAFKRCHYTRQNIRKFYYKNDKAWIQIADSLFSYKVPLNCSNITFESVENDNLHNRLCRQPYGKMACYLVAIDVLSESRFLLLSYPAGKNHSGFYLKDSNGKDKQLKGSMLWGIGRKCMVMRENVVVIFYRNKKKKYELITYKIIGSTIKEAKRERYPYEMTENSWGHPKDYFFPCNGKICIFNNKTNTIKLYKNEFLKY
jgi:hypothetical protein